MPDHAVYLEYREEEITYVTSLATDDEPNEDFEMPEMPETVDESIFFMPTYLYCKPLIGCMKFDINFDPSECDRLHLVVCRYTKSVDNELISGKWFVEGIYKTRREAKEVEFVIESDEYTSDNEIPWKGSNVEFDDVSVITLALEN